MAHPGLVFWFSTLVKRISKLRGGREFRSDRIFRFVGLDLRVWPEKRMFFAGRDLALLVVLVGSNY